MEKLSNETIDILRNDIEAALDAVDKKHNVMFQLGNITYYTDTNTAKVTLKFGPRPAGQVRVRPYRDLKG